jgi:hypothetical protein
VTDKPGRVIDDPVWLRDQLGLTDVRNLFAQEKDRFHRHIKDLLFPPFDK